MTTFEAHYSKGKQIGLAAIGLAFLALGLWMALEPASEFDDTSSRKLLALADLFGVAPATMGHAIGWLSAAMGLAVLPIVFKNLRHTGPAIRVDHQGVLDVRWSSRPIPWPNIASWEAFSIQGHRFLGLRLIDRASSPPETFRGRRAKPGAMNRRSDLSISMQGIDRSFDDLVDAFECHSAATSIPLPHMP